MESFVQRSCSSRRCTPLMVGGVVIAFDVLKTRDISEFKGIISDLLKREEMFQQVTTITLLGALDKVLHPMGFQIQVAHKSFVGAHVRAIEEEVSRRVDSYVSVLHHSAEECEEKGVEIQVKIAVGAPLTNVLLEEISSLHAVWAILGRQLSKESRCFLKQKLSCKVAQIRDNLTLEILRPYQLENYMNKVKHRLVYSMSKPVLLPPAHDDESDRNSLISLPITPMRRSNNPANCTLSSSTPTSKEQLIPSNHESCTNPQLEASDCPNEIGTQSFGCDQLMQKDGCPRSHSEEPIPLASMTKTEEDAVVSSFSEMKIEPGEYSSDTSPEDETDSKPESKHGYNQVNDKIHGGSGGFNSPGCSYENVQAATDNFSFDNFIGEGGYGIVYRGKLDDGQLVAVKVQKETKAQSCAEFLAEVSPLRFARHANIVTLLGYCCKGNLRILVYEYIGNRSLEWHLFENGGGVVDWKQRYRVAVGAAKGLQFLHEECQGSPVVHCNIRPSNILLTHDFVPMLGDFGLDKSGTSKFDKQRKLLGNLGYVAPECTDSDVRCVKADVYAFGILMMQLISGRKAVDPTAGDELPSIRQWALSYIEMLALEDLVDPGIGDEYCKYELYSMAKAAYLCVQTDPLSRPTMTEVLSILEWTNNHLRHVKSNLYPIIISAEAHLD